MQTGWPPQCSVVTGPHHRLLTQNGTLVRQVFFSKGGQTGKKGLLPNSSIKEPKKTKDGQQQSSLASQGGEKVADRAETVQWDEGELQLRAGVFFFPLEPICFLEMLLSFNKSLIRRITRNPPAAARWLQLKQAHARARPPHFLSSVHTRQTPGVHPL